MSDEALIPIVAISAVFGGPFIGYVVHTVATNWRQARVAEENAHLKRQMIERGYSADEIVRVLEAGGEPAATDTPAAK